MGSGLVVNNLSTGGQVYKLKENVSIETAHQKGLKDGLDQVYFTSGKEKYVLEGDNLKLGELNNLAKKGKVPGLLVELNSQPVKIDVEKIDDQVSTVKEGFVKNGRIASYSTTAVAIGVPVAAFSGLASIVTMQTGSAVAKAVTTGGIYVGVAATVAGAAGLLYYTGKSIAQGVGNKPNTSQTESIKQEKVNTDNNSKPAGLVSVQEKKDAATKIAVNLVLDSALDIIFGN